MSGPSAVCPDCGTPLTKSGGSEGMCVVCLLGAGASLAMSGRAAGEGGAGEFPIEFGEYDLLAEIGHGGSGRVFSARHRKLGRHVAVKILAGGGLASRDFVQRFLNEARAAASLDHPFIVPVYEVGEHEGQSFLAMRLLEGGSLARRLAKDPRSFADPDKASRFVATLARAVHFAHQHGVLHRDLKPGNVLLDSAGQPFVTDFGLARLTEQESTLTQTNAMLGTPGYMAPEQARGGLAVTTAADVYGIGAVFYEMLTGMPPFAGGTTYETVRLLLNTEPRRPSAIVPGLDRDVETICLKCLAKDPAARYASAEALAEDLDRHLRGEPIQARPVSAVVRFQKWVLRHRTVSLVSAAALLLLVGGVVLLALTNAKLQLAQGRLAQQTDSQRRDLIRMRVDTGNRQMADGDGYSALASYAEAAALESPTEAGFDARLAEHAWRFSAAQALVPDQGFLWKHGAAVYGLAFSADDRRLVTASADRTARIFDTVTGSALTPPLPHGAPVWSVAFADGERKIITRTMAGDVQLWQAESGAPAAGPFAGRKAMDWIDGVDADVPVSPDSTLFAVLLPDAVQLRRTSDGLPQGAPIFCGDQTNNAAFTPDGKRLAVLCENGKAFIFDLTADPPVKLTEYRGATGWRIGRWSADGQRLAMTDRHFGLSVPQDGVISGDQRFVHGSMVLGMQWTKDASRLLTWSFDASLRFWDANSARPVLAVMRHHGPAFSAALSPDGALVASGGQDGMARLWDALTGEHRGALLRHGGPVRKVLWSHDGRRLAAGSDDGTARIWNIGASGARHDWNPDNGSAVQRAVFSPDGSRAVVLTLNKSAFIYGIAPGDQPPLALPHPSRRPLSAAWLDNERLITASRDGAVREWKIPGDTPVREWMREPLGTEPGQSDPEPSFSPDGRLIAYNPHTRPSFLYDSLSGKRVRQLGDSVTYGLEWSPCGRFVLTVQNGGARIWEASTGRLVASPKLPSDTIITVPDYGAKRLACISETYAVYVIDGVDGRILAGPMMHSARVLSVAFAADGQSIATVTLDKNLRVWSALTGDALSPSVELSQYATSVSVHPGSRMFMAACNNGHAQIFDFPDTVRTVAQMREKVIKSGSPQPRK